MMEIYTVSFFGHKTVREFSKVEKQAEDLIRGLLLNKEYIEFLVGRNGDFDQIISSTIKRLKRLIRDDNSSLIWVLPYSTAELRNNQKCFEKYYDEIEICDAAASSHPKRAFQIRNCQMVDRSDMVVFYVERKSGGAYQTMCYAKRREKYILNLSEQIQSTNQLH